MQRDDDDLNRGLFDLCRRCVGALQVLVLVALIIGVAWLILLSIGCKVSFAPGRDVSRSPAGRREFPEERRIRRADAAPMHRRRNDCATFSSGGKNG